MKVVLMPRAERDLGKIGAYIAEDNPERAVTFVRELQDVVRSLGEWPKRFPVIARYQRADLRRRSYGNYAIFYRATGTEVLVLRIVHSAQDFGSIFPEA